MSLRGQIIRLAHQHPELRDDLMPLVRLGAEKSFKTASAVDDEVLSPPVDVGTQAGARKWFVLMKMLILNAPPGSPDRQKWITEIQKSLGYAQFLYRKNRALSKLFDDMKQQAGNLIDTFED